jgi:hypothetical protein
MEDSMAEAASVLGALVGGDSKLEGALSKVRGPSSKKAPSAPQASIGILDAAASSPSQVGWSGRNGVNGTTSPKGMGKWGVGV